MHREPLPHDDAVTTQENAIAVISAYGAFRLLMVLLAVWTFFAGFSLLTQGIGAISIGGDAGAERVAGAQLIVIAPIYGLIAWRREQYRQLLWLPYAGQLAIIVPVLYDLLANRDGHGALILIVSLIFFALLVYLWWSSHPLEHFAGFGEEEEEEWEEEEEPEEEDEEPEEPPPGPSAGGRRPPGDRNRIMRPPPM
jgi:hypothetical protein